MKVISARTNFTVYSVRIPLLYGYIVINCEGVQKLAPNSEGY